MAKIEHSGAVSIAAGPASSASPTERTHSNPDEISRVSSPDLDDTASAYPRKLVRLRSQVAKHAPLALAREDRLSKIRIDWGRAQMLGEGAAEIMGCDQGYIDGLADEIACLEDAARSEASTPEGRQRVQSARFTVLLERLHQLEGTVGRSDALKLARRVFYNRGLGDRWVKTSGLIAISAAEIEASGIPHGDKHTLSGNHEPMFKGDVAVLLDSDSFETESVDVGHLLLGLDFSEHASEHPFWIRTKKWGNVPNLVKRNEATWIGDLASATRYVAKGADPKPALADESEGDWNGNFDAIAISALASRGNTLVETLLDYYFPDHPSTEPNRHRRYEGFLMGQSFLILSDGEVRHRKRVFLGLGSRVESIASYIAGGKRADFREAAKSTIAAFVAQIQAGYEREKRALGGGE